MSIEKRKKNIATAARELLEPIATELEYLLWDVEYVKEGAEMILRITIDKEEGITIEDCEKMHRAIDPILDEADLIETSYRLEVSSPGVERVISRPEHFDCCIGDEIEVKLFAPVNSQKTISGILKEHDDKTFTVLSGEKTLTLAKSAAAKIKTVFNW